MLSRIAESLYWLGRYTERAEDSAQLLDVAVRAALEGSDMAEVLAAVLGGPPAEDGAHAPREALLRRYCLDRGASESIASCVRTARENARTVRESVTSEMWAALNTWHLEVAATGESDLEGSGTHAFLSAMKNRAFLLRGATDGTMLREEGWHWLRLGHHLERVVFTSRVLTARSGLLGAVGAAGPDASFGLAVLLRSLSAHDAFRATYRSELEPRRVAEFVLFDPHLPRSVLYSARRLAEAVTVVTDEHAGAAARRSAGRLRSALEYREVQEVLDEGLEPFLARVGGHCSQLHTALSEGPFARGSWS